MQARLACHSHLSHPRGNGVQRCRVRPFRPDPVCRNSLTRNPLTRHLCTPLSAWFGHAKTTNSRAALRRDAGCGRAPRGALPPLLDMARRAARRAARAQARRGGRAVSSRGHHVRRVRRERGHRAADSLRHRAAHHPGGRVARARSRAQAAGACAQCFHPRRVPRPGDPAGGKDSGRAGADQRAVPPRNAGASTCRATSTRTSPASTSCATAPGSSACWRTTCACPRACRTCSRTAR